MNLSFEEKLMYEVMKAIYDSGIPISFKGSMVLKICLMEAGFQENTRHTIDIDGNWISDKMPTATQMIESLQKSLDDNNLDLRVGLYRMYGRGSSAGFDFTNNAGIIVFTMDIDVNRPEAPSRIYEMEEIRFRGVSPLQMIADKTLAISSEVVFRRIKDIVDLYYISQVFEFTKEEILSIILKGERSLGDFHGFLYKTEELRHAYEKYRFTGEVYKPDFDEIYTIVKKYIQDILPE